MRLIDGKKIAQEVRASLKAQIAKIVGRKPGLAFVLVGENPASQAYVQMKKKGCNEVGIYSKILELPQEVSQRELLQEIKELNKNPKIDGILVQQPLPNQISKEAIVDGVDPDKDVDGFHPLNMGKLFLGSKGCFIPCTPLGIMQLLEKSDFTTTGKHAVIIGRSAIVGKPLAALLMQRGVDCTVTIAHSKTENLRAVCQQGDILIAAVGSPKYVDERMVKKGAIVIDVGINRTDSGIVGDVDYDKVKKVAGAVTPVPGGVGPMTIAMLLANTYQSYKNRCS